jgi:glutathione reductase (NADPH)
MGASEPSMTKYDFDLFVIGGGSGGVRAARIAAGYGAKVAIAEEYRIGGTCVMRGCVPKKLLVYASRFADDFADARGFGWTVGEARFDWPTLIAAKDRELARLEAAYVTALAKAGVELIEERATVVGPNAVRLTKSGRTLTAGKILIATGGTPSLAEPRPGREHVITSNEAFDLPRTRHHLQRGLRSAAASGQHCRCGGRLYRCGVRWDLRAPRRRDDHHLSGRQDPARI